MVRVNIQSIDFNPLFQWINNTLGTVARFAINLEGKRPQIVNIDNLWNDSGIFQSAIKEVTVDFFAFMREEETGKFWATVNLSYESYTGGKNGMTIGTCWFNPKTGWTFEAEKERFEQ